MPATLYRALQIDIENLRWWEWDMWAADVAHMTTAVITEFRAEYRDRKAYWAEVAEHMPMKSRKDVPPPRRTVPRKKR